MTTTPDPTTKGNVAGPGPSPLADELGLARDNRGWIKRDPATGMTGLPGVFVAGDMSQGPSLVVRAMADGCKAADGIRTWIETGAAQNNSIRT